MTARRALTPAARGVSLAVLAALRAGRVDLADQADGSTLATSTAPDGTVLLHAVLHMPVRGVDTRTSVLPNVSMTPQPAEVPPAPVAVPAGEATAPTTVRCWIFQPDWDAAQFRDAEAEGWLCEPVAGTVLDWTDAAPWETALVPAGMLDALRKASRRVGVTLYEGGDTPPAPAKPAPEPEDARPEPVRVNGLAPGDLIEMDGAKACVGGVDEEGFAWCTTNAKGYLTGPVERALWGEVECVEGNRWRVRPVDTGETPAQQREAARPKRARAKTAKARLTAEPAADALTTPGVQSIVWQRAAGDPWELVWSSKTHGELTVSRAWELACEGHRARQYHRNGSCTRDSRDGAK